VTMREKIRQAVEPRYTGVLVVGSESEGEGMRAVGGLINGTGATPRSGRVRVFARRIVGPEEGGSLVVGMGTSVKS
jgi:hypothetical protein